MKTSGLLLTGLLVWATGSTVVVAGFTDYLDKLKGSVSTPEETTAGVSLTDAEMVSGLKQALDKGTQFAVDSLGKEGGFLDNNKVKIPMPESLSWVEKSLRTLRQDALADEFIATMNHAAEQAVPEAAAIFGDAIQQMSVEDARGILTGPEDAATQYFRTNTEAALTGKMRPIVEQATARTGVTSAYKDMTATAGGLGSMVSSDATDLDGYVTGKTLDGLFLMIAEEEQKIRENPMARSTDLLKKVFGAHQ
jgi:hypothetical protein